MIMIGKETIIGWFFALTLMAGVVDAKLGIVTWLKPDNSDIGLRVESSLKNIALSVYDDATNQQIDKLIAAGWRSEGNKLVASYGTSPNSAVLRIRISQLPAGAHMVYIRYSSKPLDEGSLNGLIAGLEGRPRVFYDYKSSDVRIIDGLGGEERSIYEICLGQVGTADQPVTEVAFAIERYIWAMRAEFFGARIETLPSMDFAQTAPETTPKEFISIRNKLLAQGAVDSNHNLIYGVSVVSALAKVRPKSFEPLKGFEISDKIRIKCAVNEYENAQIVLFSPKQDLNAVSLSVSDITRQDAAQTKKTPICQVHPVGFVINDVSERLEKHGYWPDPILEFLDTFEVKAGDVQPVWFRVFAPEGVEAGIYNGQVTISPKNAPPFALPIEIEVRKFALPKMPHFRVVVHYSMAFPCEFVSRYKINPGLLYSRTFPGGEALVKKWADLGVTAFNVKYFDETFLDNETLMPKQEDLDKWCNEIATILNLADKYGIKDKAYVYLFDELHKQEYLPGARKISQVLAERFPTLLQLTTAMDASYLGESSGLVNISAWCPPLHLYRYEQAQRARKAGKQVWYYTSTEPVAPYPNIFLTEPAMNTRLLVGFMAAAYQSDGFLFYLIHPMHKLGEVQIDKGPYTQWRSDCDGRHEGTAQWCFMGPKGPIPTQRLETIRDGLEDLDYLFLAQQKYERVGGNLSEPLKEKWREIEKLMQPGNKLVRSLTDYSHDIKELQEVRELLADFVEKI